MPGFVIEAMHYGVPCVVSAENGMASAVRESGSGVVVEDRSPEAYAAAIEALLRSPDRLQEMSANGRRMTAERLNWTFVAGAMLPGLKRAAGEGGRDGVRTCSAVFPLAAERDPERQENQPDVEPETLPGDVNLVVAELEAARNIAWREDLCDAGQARPKAGAVGVTRNVLERDERAVARLYFAGTQGARTDKAHVATKDVPELRQFVHRGRAHQVTDAGDPRVALGRLQRPHGGLSIRDHRAELEPALPSPTRFCRRTPPPSSSLMMRPGHPEQRRDGQHRAGQGHPARAWRSEWA
jgi:hypothetical protein